MKVNFLMQPEKGVIKGRSDLEYILFFICLSLYSIIYYLSQISVHLEKLTCLKEEELKHKVRTKR